MARDNWNRHLDAQANYHENEDARRRMEHENEYWHSNAGGHHIRYNDARNEEISRRNQEILRNLKNLFLSKIIGIILIISIGLSLLTSIKAIVTGIIVWNILIFVLMCGFYRIFAKTQVRPEISREQAIRQSARDQAYRR